MPNEDLHKPLKSINESIADLRSAILRVKGEVTKVQTVIQESAETIRDAIQENIQAQAELKLMDHLMDVRAVKPQIAAEHDQIQAEREELDQRLESISERYQRKQDELNETAQERIRELGSHIFEIDEEQFEEGIEEPFTDQVTKTWQLLQAHNENVREERDNKLHETTDEVVQSIHNFMDRQESLVETVQNYRLDADEVSLSGNQIKRLQVPYYLVEYEADGVTQQELIVPSRLSTDDQTDWCEVSLSPISGTQEIMDEVSRKNDPSYMESLSKAEVVSALDEHGKSSWLGLSYADAVANAIPKEGHIPIYLPEDEG